MPLCIFFFVKNIINFLEICLKVWIHVPMVAETCAEGLVENEVKQKLDGSDGDQSESDSWRWWSTLRTVCNHNKRLGIGEKCFIWSCLRPVLTFLSAIRILGWISDRPVLGFKIFT